MKLVEAQSSRLPPPPPQSPRAKTSEEVQPNEAKLDDHEKEDENKASQKVAKREKEVETSASYYSSG